MKKARNDSTSRSTSSELIGHTNQTRRRKTHSNEKKKFSNQNCRFCGKPNWSLEHICPARKAQCNNCKKMGHFASVQIQDRQPSNRSSIIGRVIPSHGRKLIIFNPSTVLTESILTKQSYWSTASK